MRDTSDIKDMRDALMAAIIDLAKDHPEVVFLDSDLSSCINSGPFAKQFPDRFFNCGIAEANMVGVASGLSSMGFVPHQNLPMILTRKNQNQTTIPTQTLRIQE